MSDKENDKKLAEETTEDTVKASAEKPQAEKKEKKGKKEKPSKTDKSKENERDGEKDNSEKSETKLDNINGKTEEEASSKYKYVIQNKKVRTYSKNRKLVIIVAIFLLLTLIVGSVTYAIMLRVEQNNFRVLVDKEGEEILSLSIDDSFSYPTEVLAISGPQFMDNISLEDFKDKLPEIEASNGAASGEKYIAATFFLSNVSQKQQLYRERIEVSEVTREVDSALRVMVIKGGERTVYAKTRADGTPEEVVPGRYFTKSGDPHDSIWMTTPFSDARYVMNNENLPIEVGEIVKYTVIIWLEGWDAECVNAILGGTIKLDFEFSRM